MMKLVSDEESRHLDQSSLTLTALPLLNPLALGLLELGKRQG